jgi:hypothetical protein
MGVREMGMWIKGGRETRMKMRVEGWERDTERLGEGDSDG